mgnify:CR=1 FL=1
MRSSLRKSTSICYSMSRRVPKNRKRLMVAAVHKGFLKDVKKHNPAWFILMTIHLQVPCAEDDHSCWPYLIETADAICASVFYSHHSLCHLVDWRLRPADTNLLENGREGWLMMTARFCLALLGREESKTEDEASLRKRRGYTCPWWPMSVAILSPHPEIQWRLDSAPERTPK